MTVSLDDLRPLAETSGPFLTLLLPAPSKHADAAERFAIVCKNAVRRVSDEWPSADLEALESELATLPHDAGTGVIVVRPVANRSVVEFVDEPLRASVLEGPQPRLAPLIRARQHTVAHVLVEADKAGASLAAFDGGDVLATGEVEGETLHIHRGHAGGWSQRRFQQRAENTWEENADDIAEAAAKMAVEVDARLIVVAGPARARSMVTQALNDRVRAEVDVTPIEAGDEHGIVDAVAELVTAIADADSTAAVDAATESMATTEGFDGDVMAALRAGRVEMLVVHDDGDTTSADRHIDRCIIAALASGAAIHVVGAGHGLRDGVAAILRW